MDTNKPQVIFRNLDLIALNMLIYDMPKATIDNVNLSHSVFKLVDMPASGIDETCFDSSVWRSCDLTDSCIADSDFSNAKMQQIDMHSAGFTRVKFNNATLKEVDLSYGIMLEVDFTGASLIGVNFEGVNFDYPTINFTDAKLSNCYIEAEIVELLNLTDEQRKGLLSAPIKPSAGHVKQEIEKARQKISVSDDTISVKIPIPVMPH